MNRSDLQRLATVRLEEAQQLLSASRFDGAYYLAGYAVECALKATIAKTTRQYDFPDKQRVSEAHTHNLKNLLRLAELDGELKRSSQSVQTNWDIVQQWTEASRYAFFDERQAVGMLDAVGDGNAGVILWLSNHW